MGSNINFNTIGDIATRQKKGNGKKLPSLHDQLQEVFQLQNDIRQPSTTPQIYYMQRPGQPASGCSGDSNMRTHAWEPGVVTTRPRRIPSFSQTPNQDLESFHLDCSSKSITQYYSINSIVMIAVKPFVDTPGIYYQGSQYRSEVYYRQSVGFSATPLYCPKDLT